MPIAIRPATADDQDAIVSLVHSERLNPCGLPWANFLVAVDEGRIVGAVQMRRHKDGSRELGSLVVAAPQRGRGIASRLIDALLAREPGRVLMITGQAYAGRYAHWGFEPVRARAAPRSVRRNYRLGSLAGSLAALIVRRPRNRLIILDRDPMSTQVVPAFAVEA